MAQKTNEMKLLRYHQLHAEYDELSFFSYWLFYLLLCVIFQVFGDLAQRDLGVVDRDYRGHP